MFSLRVVPLKAPRGNSLEAVRGGQHPAGVDQDPAALVMVLPVSRLVHVNEGLPRLLSDVALPTTEHAVHGPIQQVALPLTTRLCGNKDDDDGTFSGGCRQEEGKQIRTDLHRCHSWWGREGEVWLGQRDVSLVEEEDRRRNQYHVYQAVRRASF